MSVNEEKEKLYYMAIAILSERRSKDPVRQVGACIVNEKERRIIGVGYNGMPIGCRDNLMQWSDRSETNEKMKHLYVTHAEMNAVVNMTPKSVEGCSVYVTLHPCYECAKILHQSGIRKVLYLSYDTCYRRKKEFLHSRELLSELKDDGQIGYDQLSCSGPAPTKCKMLKLVFDGSLGDAHEHAKWLPNSREYQLGQKFDAKEMEVLESKKELTDQEYSRRERVQARLEKSKKLFTPISWEQYFMGMAIVSGHLMADNPPSTVKEGACIANEDNRIVGLGYFRFEQVERGNKKTRIDQHAPVAAIVNTNPVSVRDCTLYVSCFPCNECAKVIVQSGIKAVVYMEKQDQAHANQKDAAGTRMKSMFRDKSKQVKTDAPGNMMM